MLRISITFALLLAAWAVDARESTPRIAHDIDGNSYPLLRIGGADWFGANLRTTRSADGSPLVSAPPDADASHVQRFGLLYDWDYARNACPSGFRLPTDADWSALEKVVEASDGFRFASPLAWGQEDPANANVRWDFALLPAGYANSSGLDPQFGATAVLWSASADGPDFAWARSFRVGSTRLSRASQHTHYGFSVRCVSDPAP